MVCEVMKVEIRKANHSDYIKIVRSIQNKNISYITPTHVREDIQHNRLFVGYENGKVVGILSLVWDSEYNYFAMKRLCITNKKNQGKGLAQELLTHVSETVNGKVGCTPWSDNAPMRHTLEKLGFTLEYRFSEKWCFYSKLIHTNN
jgi:RimJ/RimL family protein N-acetyltransferase